MVDAECPDFLTRNDGTADCFGVEIADFFHSETDARLKRIPNYGHDLLAGKDFKHRDDKRSLHVDKVDLLNEDNVIKAKGIPAIIQQTPSLSECASMVASLIHDKSDKLLKTTHVLSHVNLIVHDTTRLLDRLRIKDFFPIYFVPDLRESLARSRFREVFFIMTIANQHGFIPLNMLHLLSEVYFFHAQLPRSKVAIQLLDNADGLTAFASYFKENVTGTVYVRHDADGTEVIYGDSGILVASDRSIRLRMYYDYPLPGDCEAVATKLDSSVCQEFGDEMKELRYCQILWMPSCFRRRFVPPHQQTVPRR